MILSALLSFGNNTFTPFKTHTKYMPLRLLECISVYQVLHMCAYTSTFMVVFFPGWSDLTAYTDAALQPSTLKAHS